MALTQVQSGMLAGATSTTTPIQVGSTTIATFTSNTSLGIGTTNPTGRSGTSNILQLNGGEPEIRMTAGGTGNNTFISFAPTAGADAWISNTSASSNLIFANGGYLTERMRITSGGNLLIGTTTMTGSDATVYTYRTDGNYNFTANNTNSGLQGFFAFRYNGSGVGSITGNNTATAYNTFSDYRLKDNVAPMTGALAKVSQLKPVTYKWKLDGSDGEGFIAHELSEVCPLAVTGEKDAIEEDGSIKAQGIDTSFLVATLTAAIQELNAKVTALETQLAAK